MFRSVRNPDAENCVYNTHTHIICHENENGIDVADLNKNGYAIVNNSSSSFCASKLLSASLRIHWNGKLFIYKFTFAISIFFNLQIQTNMISCVDACQFTYLLAKCIFQMNQRPINSRTKLAGNRFSVLFCSFLLVLFLCHAHESSPTIPSILKPSYKIVNIPIKHYMYSV